MQLEGAISKLDSLVKEHRGRGFEIFISVSTMQPPAAAYQPPAERPGDGTQRREVYLCLARKVVDLVVPALDSDAAREQYVQALRRSEQQILVDGRVDPADRSTVEAGIKQWFDRSTATKEGVEALLRSFGKDISYLLNVSVL